MDVVIAIKAHTHARTYIMHRVFTYQCCNITLGSKVYLLNLGSVPPTPFSVYVCVCVLPSFPLQG